MYKSTIRLSAFLAVGLLAVSGAAAREEASSAEEQYTLATGDPDYDAMPNAPGKDEVFAYCSACHSLKLVTQQNLSRDRWDYLLEWMVEEQGMSPLPDDEQKIVLDYLADHYGSKTQAGSPGK